MWIAYQFAVALTLLVAGPFLLMRRGRHYLASIPARLTLGRFTPQPPGHPKSRETIWLHAVSVGEVGVAKTLLSALPPDSRALVTTITPTGQERARTELSDRATVAYLPFDLGFAVSRFLHRFSPRALVLVEGDLWPLLLQRTRQRGIPVAVVNGRISDRSYRRMRRLRPLLGPLLRPIDSFGMQTEEDRRRLIALGVPKERVVRTGNLKFDSAAPATNPELLEKVRGLAGDRPVLLAGSTMKAEEELVLEAFRKVNGKQSALLILAPRHPERWNEVEILARESGLRVARRSALATAPASPDVLILDSMGELAGLYAAGIGAFIGGTLVPTGGHNPLEPAFHGIAIAAGPSMDNFREIEQMFDRALAWQRVANPDELAQAWLQWITDPESARELGSRASAILERNRGALARTLEFLEPLLEPISIESG